MSGDKAWKAYERWVAKLFGTTRNPLSGKNAGGDRTGDIIHKDFNVECKNHKSMTIVDWMKKCKNESSKIPLLFCHKKNTPYTESVVCLTYDDFEYLMQRGLHGVIMGKKGVRNATKK